MVFFVGHSGFHLVHHLFTSHFGVHFGSSFLNISVFLVFIWLIMFFSSVILVFNWVMIVYIVSDNFMCHFSFIQG